MDVIFIKDLKNQGKKGQVKTVKDGYAENFLIKNGYAVKKTKENLLKLNQEQAKKAKEDQANKEEALKLSEEVYNMNETRKSLTDECFNTVSEYIKNNDSFSMPIILVKSKEIEQGLTGLIAGKVLNEYGKTAIILHEDEELGICTGSIRSRGNNNAREMLEFTSVYLNKFGGHKNAAGFSLNIDKFDKFAEKIIKYSLENNL